MLTVTTESRQGNRWLTLASRPVLMMNHANSYRKCIIVSMVLRHSGASLEDGKKITLPPLPLDFDLKTQNRDHPSFKNARVRQGCAPPNPKTPRIWGFHFCHHLRRAKRGGLLVRTYFALPPSTVPEGVPPPSPLPLDPPPLRFARAP